MPGTPPIDAHSKLLPPTASAASRIRQPYTGTVSTATSCRPIARISAAASRAAARSSGVPVTLKPLGAEPSAARSLTIRRIWRRSNGSARAVAICSV